MVAWLSIALALQILGSVILAVEVHNTHRRWHQKFRSRQVVAVGVAMDGSGAFSVEAEAVPPADESVEQRLDRIEAQQRSQHEQLRGELARVESTISDVADEKAQAVARRIQPQVSSAIQYLAGLGERPRWRPRWLGPALVLLGTVVSGVVSVVAAIAD